MKQQSRSTGSSARSARMSFPLALVAIAVVCLSVVILIAQRMPELGAGDSDREYIPAVNLTIKPDRSGAASGPLEDEGQPGVGIYFRVAKQFRGNDAEEYIDDGGYDEIYYQDENHSRMTVHLGGLGGGDESEVLATITDVKNGTTELHEERSVDGTLLQQDIYDIRVDEEIENEVDEFDRVVAQSRFGTRRISAELMDRLIALSVVTVTGAITIDGRAATQVEFLESSEDAAVVMESRETAIDDETGFVLRDELQSSDLNGEAADHLLVASEFNETASLPTNVFGVVPDSGGTRTNIVQKPFDLNDGEPYPSAAQISLVRTGQVIAGLGEIKAPIFVSGTLNTPPTGLMQGWYVRQRLVNETSGRIVQVFVAPEGGDVPSDDPLNWPVLASDIVAEQAEEVHLVDSTAAMVKTLPADPSKSDVGDFVHYLTWETTNDIRMIVTGNRLIESRKVFLDIVNAWIDAPQVVP